MKVIPAIDIVDGKCVRLTQGNFGTVKIYDEDPLDVAKRFEDADIEHIHLVDLDGAERGMVTNWDTVESIRANTALRIDFGGGVKTSEDVDLLLEMNIDQINVGSVAVKEPEKFREWIRKFGAENFILSTDVKGKSVQVSGWQETTAFSVYDLVSLYLPDGVRTVTCTDISADGMLAGPNFALYKKLINRFPGIRINASGGVSSIGDVEKLQYIGVSGVIIGKAIYEGRIKLEELAGFNH